MRVSLAKTIIMTWLKETNNTRSHQFSTARDDKKNDHGPTNVEIVNSRWADVVNGSDLVVGCRELGRLPSDRSRKSS
jgi:hypothetical protein